MAGEIDYGEADTVLRNTWEEVNESEQSTYIDDYRIRQGLGRVLGTEEYATKTFKYMLLTNIVVFPMHAPPSSPTDGSVNRCSANTPTPADKSTFASLGGFRGGWPDLLQRTHPAFRHQLLPLLGRLPLFPTMFLQPYSRGVPFDMLQNQLHRLWGCVHTLHSFY